MITSIYAALSSLLIVWLSFNVVKLRQSGRVILGDGGNSKLQVAIRAQGNATEYIPISLILLLLLELSKANALMLHIGGVALLIGRSLHAYGLTTSNLKLRVSGMVFTFGNIIYLAIVNLVYFYLRT
ncbi:MAPEG family protein [Pseudanabaena sp. Chao 1811]|uniref:MAPEG family protein n=1 Tax=Pseudanabaena sp. Chao 1811 TaxID=2963092 RepID=UPI0022F3A7FE|nr:MAPEG family protein [Pseudanabaena sp. Chao 1811]